MEATSNSVMDFAVFLKLTEPEARALNALTLYGTNTILKAFYQELGHTYLKQHEKGLVLLFDSIRNNIPHHLNRIDKTRETFKELNPNP